MHRTIINIVAWTILILLHLPSYCQEYYTTKNTEAIELYKGSFELYKGGNDASAAKNLRQAIGLDSNFVEAYMLLSEIYTDHKKYDDVLKTYRTAVRRNGDALPECYFYLGNAENYFKNYENAKKALDKYLSFSKINKTLKKTAEDMLVRCDFILNAMNNPVPFVPKNMGHNINTEYDEYLPALTADEQTLVITAKVPKKQMKPGETDPRQEDFFISTSTGGTWSKAVSIGTEINTPQNEGAQTISADGMYLYFTACNRRNGYGQCDIFFSKKSGDRWSKPMNLGNSVNTAHWESQPSISSNGKTLYFISTRPGGYGNTDIWRSTKQKDGTWSPPVNLGPEINTKKAELSPFIHSDNQTLYFASKGLTGMGGFDIFVTRKDKDGRWQKPENLGYPINTAADENSLIVNAKGDKAYFAGDRPGGYGGIDLYEFDLDEKLRPVSTTYMKGVVFDAETNDKLEAQFELIDLETAEVVIQAYSDKSTGRFLVCLPTNKNYALNVSREGYLFYSGNFSLKDSHDDSKPFHKDVPLQPIQVGETVILKNIFFDTDKYDLKSESIAELNKLITFLKDNPAVKIEIRGHTDNQGSEEHNTLLSDNRAKAVYNYLTENSVNKTRLSYKGYGEKQPIATNDTPEGRAINRRTEFKIVE